MTKPLNVVCDRLYVPKWIAPDAYTAIRTLLVAECDGGDGEYDEPADTILRRMYNRNPIHEWDALRVTTAHARFVVFEGLRIEFSLTPYIKRCYLCNRVMAEHECGDEADEERMCGECVRETTISQHLCRYLRNRTKRTGTYWALVKRYALEPHYPDDITWQRALIEDTEGNQVRIYYSPHKRCWRRS